MFGLTMHRSTTADATPREAAQKILDGVSQLAAWAVHGIHLLASGQPLTRRAEAKLQEVQARLDVEELCAAGGEARAAIQQRYPDRRNAPVEHPDQTQVHMTPHPTESAPAHNGVHSRPAPTHHDAIHSRAASRHH